MYVDTSVMVKLFVAEPDSELCEAIVSGTTLVSSRLLYCELRSAILGKVSRGVIPAGLGTEVWQEFERRIVAQKIRFLALDGMIVQDATELLNELHPKVSLRALDALHLATYLSAEVGPLFTKDVRMLRAAEQLGLPLAG
jgi:predicted nucleic acid-binding protein